MLAAEYHEARRTGEIARLRRVFALRAMAVSGLSQRQIAEALGISQSAVSQQLKFSADLDQVHPETVLEAAAPVLKKLAEYHGYTQLKAFGSVARNQARLDSDIDLLVQAPSGTSSFAFVAFKRTIEDVLGREIDLVPYDGLKSELDDDIRREAVLL